MVDAAKRAAAVAALEHVEPGMRLGLGTGSTAALFVAELGARVAAGLDVRCVPTSEATRAQAAALGIQLTTLEATPALDLTVDGADEIAPDLALIKGGGGALLQEKIVAAASARMVVIADAGKAVARLGAFALPVEVVRFGWAGTARRVEAASGCRPRLRLRDGAPVVTDEGHHILDLDCGEIDDPGALHATLKALTGVVETGLFIGLATEAILGDNQGGTRRLGTG